MKPKEALIVGEGPQVILTNVHRILVITFFCIILIPFACGGSGNDRATGKSEPETGNSRVIEKTGSIDSGDRTDPNHGNLAYDGYEFKARPIDKIRVEVKTKDFSPLLKLVEVSTGAVIAEWDAQYPTGDEKALVYTIAGPGVYEARVYAMRAGTGSYSVRITISHKL
jgi:hypothetical protein